MQHIFAPQDTHVHILSIPAWQSVGEKQFPLLVIIRLVLVLFGRINWSQLKWMPSARLECISPLSLQHVVSSWLWNADMGCQRKRTINTTHQTAHSLCSYDVFALSWAKSISAGWFERGLSNVRKDNGLVLGVDASEEWPKFPSALCKGTIYWMSIHQPCFPLLQIVWFPYKMWQSHSTKRSKSQASNLYPSF